MAWNRFVHSTSKNYDIKFLVQMIYPLSLFVLPLFVRYAIALLPWLFLHCVPTWYHRKVHFDPEPCGILSLDIQHAHDDFLSVTWLHPDWSYVHIVCCMDKLSKSGNDGSLLYQEPTLLQDPPAMYQSKDTSLNVDLVTPINHHHHHRLQFQLGQVQHKEALVHHFHDSHPAFHQLLV